MVINEYTFTVDRWVAAGATTIIKLDRNPFGIVVPANCALFCDLNICISGASSSTLVFDRWSLAWRFDGNGHVSTSGSDLQEVRYSTWGGNVPSNVVATIYSYNPAISITMHAYSGNNLVCTGKAWASSGS